MNLSHGTWSSSSSCAHNSQKHPSFLDRTPSSQEFLKLWPLLPGLDPWLSYLQPVSAGLLSLMSFTQTKPSKRGREGLHLVWMHMAGQRDFYSVEVSLWSKDSCATSLWKGGSQPGVMLGEGREWFLACTGETLEMPQKQKILQRPGQPSLKRIWPQMVPAPGLRSAKLKEHCSY